MMIDERSRKWFILAGFVLISSLFGLALYFLFFRGSPIPLVPTTPTTPISGSLPGSGSATNQPATSTTNVGVLPPGQQRPGSVTNNGAPTITPPPSTVVLNEQVTQYVSPSAAKDGFRSYNAADGKFYRLLPDGSRETMTDQAFFDVQHVSWGNKSDKAVLEFPDGSNVVYDFRSNRQVTLPKYWEDFSFSPNDDQIAAKSVGNNETNRFLVVANSDGSNPRPIQELGNNQDKVQVSWSPNNQIVAFAHTGDEIGFDRESIILIGQNHENYKALVTEGRGFIPNWSPSGSTLLYSVYNSTGGYVPQLWISGASGDTVNANRRQLELNTWADKCAWSSDEMLYCAVPSEISVGAGLQRDASPTGPDSIVRINLRTGQKTNLGQPTGKPNVQQLTISNDQTMAFFTDRVTGQFIRYTFPR